MYTHSIFAHSTPNFISYIMYNYTCKIVPAHKVRNLKTGFFYTFQLIKDFKTKFKKPHCPMHLQVASYSSCVLYSTQ